MQRLLQTLWERRVLQLVGLYIAIGWGTVEVVDWFSQRYSFSPDWAELVLIVLLSLTPAVTAVAWVHGRPGPQRVTRSDLIVVPVNLGLAAVLAWLVVSRSDLVAGRTSRTVQTTTRLTFLDAQGLGYPTFLPDGTSIAFLSADSLGISVLRTYLRDPGRVDTLLQAATLRNLRWTPTDGLTVFTQLDAPSRPGLHSVDPDNGAVRRLCSTLCSRSADGDRIAVLSTTRSSHFEIRRWSDSGPDSLVQRVEMLEPAMSGRFITWSPAGDAVAVQRGGWTAPDGSTAERIDIVNIRSGEQWTVATGPDVRLGGWSSDGTHVDYVDGTLRWRQSTEQSSGAPAGDPEDLGQLPRSVTFPAFSADGRQAVVSRSNDFAALMVWIDLSEADTLAYERRVTSPANPDFSKGALSISPDGSAVAFHDWDSRYQLSLWDVATESITARTYPSASSAVPRITRWSPSGNEILVVLPGSPARFIRVALDGNRAPEISAYEIGASVEWCAEDEILRQMPDNADYLVSNVRSGEVRELLGERSEGWMFDPQCSPDGRWIAFRYNHRREGQGLRLIDRGGGADRILLTDTTQQGIMPHGWSPDGRWVYYSRLRTYPVEIRRVPAAGGEPELVVRLPFATSQIALARDASALATIEIYTKQDLFLIDNLDAAGGGGDRP